MEVSATVGWWVGGLVRQRSSRPVSGGYALVLSAADAAAKRSWLVCIKRLTDPRWRQLQGTRAERAGGDASVAGCGPERKNCAMID